MDFIVFLTMLALGYGVGSWMERRHYTSIEKREAGLLELPVLTIRRGFPADGVRRAELVHGSAVISVDYFKRLLATIRNIFGGTIRSYETLIDRARREAVLRMKEAAPPGTSLVVNVRVETSTIGRSTNNKSVSCVEVIAYGTALVLDE